MRLKFPYKKSLTISDECTVTVNKVYYYFFIAISTYLFVLLQSER